MADETGMANGEQIKRRRASRRRAVILTPEALERLQKRLAEVWAERGEGRQLTRPMRADLLGVSVLTSDRILTGQGVDRATLRLAFENLSLAWHDSYCILARLDVLEPEPATAKGAEAAPSEAAPSEAAPSELMRHQPSGPVPFPYSRAYACGALLLLFVVLLPFVIRSVRRLSPPAVSGRGAARPVTAAELAWHTAQTRLHILAADEYHRGDYPAARRHIQEAIAMAKKHDGYVEMAQALKVYGDLEDERGDLASAKARYHEALTLWRVVNIPKCAAPVYEAAGELETRTGEWKQARTDLTAALRIFRDTHDDTGVAMCCRDLGSLASRQGDPKSAERWFQRSLLTAAALPNGKPIVMDVQGRRAEMLYSRGRFRQARSLLNACLVFWKQQKHPRWVAVSERRLGRLECLSGNARSGRALLKKSLSAFERLGDRASVSACREALRRAGAVARPSS